jgi:hypothetical protein
VPLEAVPEDAADFFVTSDQGQVFLVRAWTSEVTCHCCARYHSVEENLIIDGEASYRTADEWVAVAEVAASIAREYRTQILKVERKHE